MKITKTNLNFIREKLTAPFGFKGNYLNELWQTVVSLSDGENTAVCPAVQSVLWADANVFASAAPAATNAMMLNVTSKALKLLEGLEFSTPPEAIKLITPKLTEYAKVLCGFEVMPTFILNALVAVDLALWMLYAKQIKATHFDDIIPKTAAFATKSDALVKIPLISYNVNADELKKTLDCGSALLKIKIGAFTGATGKEDDMRLMLEADKKRLSEVHDAAKSYSTAYTKSGKVLYYLDANGRYDSHCRIEQLLEHADKIGALGSIALLEEPFALDSTADVSSLPVCVTADESAHSVFDVEERLALGYKAIALKPIAKTLSLSLEMATAAHASGGSCFCADLTVNPLLTEWNKQIAARISPLPGMLCGAVEVNGDMNYVNWKAMKQLLPDGYPYTEEQNAIFRTDKGFFECGVRLFEDNGYKNLIY